MARARPSMLLMTSLLLTFCGVASARDGPVALVTDTNSSHVGRRHLLSHGVTCATVIDLTYETSPYSTQSNDKTNFLSGGSCSTGLDAVFLYSVPAYTRITFYPPYSYQHSYHTIQFGGSCPGNTMGSCSYASDRIYITNTGVTSVTLYYTQSGFSSADSELNVRWTIEGTAPPPSPPPPSPPPPSPPPYISPTPTPYYSSPTSYYSPTYYYRSGSSSDDTPIGLIVGVVVGVLVLLGGIAAAVVWHKRKSKSDSEPKDFSSAVIGYPQATDPESIELQVVPTAQPVPSPAPPSIPSANAREAFLASATPVASAAPIASAPMPIASAVPMPSPIASAPMPVATATAVASPPPPPPQAQTLVTVPPGVVAGQLLHVQSPSGQTMAVTVPPGVPPGGQFPVIFS